MNKYKSKKKKMMRILRYLTSLLFIVYYDRILKNHYSGLITYAMNAKSQIWNILRSHPSFKATLMSLLYTLAIQHKHVKSVRTE